MSKYIKTFGRGTTERTRLEKAAEIMTERSPKGYKYYVGETYFDYGQNWKWTTILCDKGFQALYPAEQEEIITGGIEEAVRKVMAGEYFSDKIDPERIAEKNAAAVKGLVDMYGKRAGE